MAGPIPTRKISQLTVLGAPLSGNEQLELWVINTSRRVTTRDFCLPAVDPIVMSVDMSSTHPASRYLADSPSVVVVDNGPGQSIQFVATGTSGQLPTAVQAEATSVGTINNFALTVGTGALDVDTTLGNVTITGITPGINGQFLIVTNTGPNLLNLLALNGGSAAANRLRLPADMTFLLYGGVTLRYFDDLALWIPV